MVGEVYGRLIVLAMYDAVNYKQLCLCRCACGTQKIVYAYNLKDGAVKSCGCLRREATQMRGRANSKGRTRDFYECKRKTTRRDWKAEAVVYKGGKCALCGIIDSPCVYDFHHIDPASKDFNLGNSTSRERMFEELDKCILICSNCHRKLHFS